MKRLFSTILIFALVANMTFAQNTTKKFAFGVSGAMTDFITADTGNKLYSSENINFYPGPVHFNIAYNIIKPINIATGFTFGDVDKYNYHINDNSYWKWDAGVQVRFLSFILDDDHWFDPYIFGNGGVFHINNQNSPVLNGGLGLNVWLNEYFALNVASGYNYGFDLDKDFNETTFGIKIRLGKGADRDGDGISDKKDSCPDVAGLEAFNGCPDSDGDGIADKDDACPNTKGLAALNGCPDTDGDGIADKDDACPEVKGLVALNGCPDTDGDGVADKDDACPTVKGIAKLKGCPDTDGDGISDKDDACPNKKGSVATNGCPDRDNDGIIDSKDACPDKAGIAALNGCPKMKEEKKKEIEEKIRFSAKNIQFNTGKSTIKTVSYKDIDNVISIMKTYTKVKFFVEGHTDNTGDYNKNKTLSQERADAVKNYIVNKGIAASRLDAKGYGSDKPIDTNKTRAGRQNNRRVEFIINQ